ALEVPRDHGEAPGPARREVGPEEIRRRDAIAQQQRRALALAAIGDPGAVGGDERAFAGGHASREHATGADKGNPPATAEGERPGRRAEWMSLRSCAEGHVRRFTPRRSPRDRHLAVAVAGPRLAERARVLAEVRRPAPG